MGKASRLKREKPLRPALHPEFIETYLEEFFEISANKTYPSVVYRYRSCQTPFFATELERMLRGQFFLPSQLQLNDPFDCRPAFEPGMTFADYSRYIEPVICAIRTEMGREREAVDYDPEILCAMIASNLALESRADMIEGFERKLPGMISEMLEKTGVLSLTSDKNNLVLWSTYANRGDGICIGLADPHVRVDDFYSARPVQVQYQASRPRLDYWGAIALFLLSTVRAAQYIPPMSHVRLMKALSQVRWAWTKQERWQYEDEFRIVGFKLGGEQVELSARISAIYIGDRVSKQTRDAILSIASAAPYSVPLFSARRSPTVFAMEFSPIG